jgi:hypothetical protein
MNVIDIISSELERWEAIRTDSIAQYNRASLAIETLKDLTDRMREVAEHGHEAKANTAAGQAKQA